jgi:DNA-directed RNA polymerase subunit K/omega
VTEPTKPKSEYLFVEVAAQRCMQLMRGARPKLETKAHKYTSLAIEEVSASTVPWTLEDPEPDDSDAADGGAADAAARDSEDGSEVS